MDRNLKALKARASDSPALARFEELARLLTGKSSAAADQGVDWVRSLCADLAAPRLSRFGITAADLPLIAEKAQKSSSMRGNPVELTLPELIDILNAALQ
jgi:alcohol dehydrogenase class IV